MSSQIHDLKSLVLSYHPVIAIETTDELRTRDVIRSLAFHLRLPFREWSVTTGLSEVVELEGQPGTREPIQLMTHLDGVKEDSIFLLKDFTQHLERPVVIRQFKEVIQKFSRRGSAIFLIGAKITLPPELEHKVLSFDLELPALDEIKVIVEDVANSINQRQKVQIQLTREDVPQLLKALSGLTASQVRKTVAYAILQDGKLTREDISLIQERKAEFLRESGLLDYYSLKENQFQLGGFDKLKQWLERSKVGFTEEAKALNLPAPKGVLITGVQGCGKSLAAKVIAREWQMPLIKLDMGRLFDKYIGETERKLRKAIQLAESMAPNVLWIDEIEKALPSGDTAGSNDGGLSRRMFGTLLTWFQEKKHPVFVVATANDLSGMPPELLRKGRFDEIFFVDLPNEKEREEIFKIHLKLRRQDPAQVSLPELVAASNGFSGAEIEQAVIASFYQALHQKKKPGTELILAELRSTVPLSATKREEIAWLREQAKGRFVNVSSSH